MPLMSKHTGCHCNPRDFLVPRQSGVDVDVGFPHAANDLPADMMRTLAKTNLSPKFNQERAPVIGASVVLFLQSPNYLKSLEWSPLSLQALDLRLAEPRLAALL